MFPEHLAGFVFSLGYFGLETEEQKKQRRLKQI